MMKTYNVSGIVTVSVFTKVRAESEEEALEKAAEAATGSVCYHCTQREEGIWNFEDMDGEVEPLRAEEDD